MIWILLVGHFRYLLELVGQDRLLARVPRARARRHKIKYGVSGRSRNRCGLRQLREEKPAALFDRLVANASLPIVVDYWAPWCGPCRMVAPELEKVAARLAGRVLVVKVNTDALSDLGERFRIRSIPTMAVFDRRPRKRRTSRTTKKPGHESTKKEIS